MGLLKNDSCDLQENPNFPAWRVKEASSDLSLSATTASLLVTIPIARMPETRDLQLVEPYQLEHQA